MLNEIREAMKKVTPGPWSTGGYIIENGGSPLRGTYRTIAVTNAATTTTFNNDNYEADAHFIANAPEWVSYLLSRVEEQRKLLVDADSILSFLHHRGYIKYEKQGCPSSHDINMLIGELRK